MGEEVKGWLERANAATIATGSSAVEQRDEYVAHSGGRVPFDGGILPSRS